MAVTVFRQLYCLFLCITVRGEVRTIPYHGCMDTQPLYLQLADDIAAQISARVLRAGERLPSLRQMKLRRGLSLSTVQQAFRRLEDLGLVEARPQSGYFVRYRSEAGHVLRLAAPTEVAVDPLLWSYVEDQSEQRTERMQGFRSAVAPHALLPIAQLQRYTLDCMRRHPDLLSDYGRPSGYLDFKRQIARLAMEWGGQLHPEQLIVTQGTIEALNLALRALTQPGDVVAVESPAYFSLLYTLKALGLRVVEIPTDPVSGISVDALELATRDAAIKAVILVPNFSNPLGALMPDAAKEKVADMLAARGIPLIEDDVYGEFYYGRQRPRPIKAFDRSGNVLYCASLTKDVAPGLRIGWIDPGRYRSQVEVQKYLSTHSTPTLNQAVLARFLESGAYPRHMRRLRRTIASQMQSLLDGLARYFPPDVRYTRPQGGFVLWLEFPLEFDSLALHRLARQEGIGLAPGPLFSPRGDYRHCLRLSCAEPWTEAQQARLARLGELVRQQYAD
jgi:DNA-binding transcriptional MocR family regulator